MEFHTWNRRTTKIKRGRSSAKISSFSKAAAASSSTQGDDQHALASDDYIDVKNGNIQVVSAVKDAIHTNDGFLQSGGSIELAADGDGVDAGDGPVLITGGSLDITVQEEGQDGLKCDGTVTINGGLVSLNINGDRGKGINAVEVLLTEGALDINTTGDVVLESAGSGLILLPD